MEFPNSTAHRAVWVPPLWIMSFCRGVSIPPLQLMAQVEQAGGSRGTVAGTRGQLNLEVRGLGGTLQVALGSEQKKSETEKGKFMP